MKILIIVISLTVPIWGGYVHKRDASAEVKETSIIKEETKDIPITSTTETDINVDQIPLPVKSNIPEDAVLQRVFNGSTYEILTTKAYGVREYLNLDYNEAVEACKKSHPKPRTLLTFKSAEENAFIAKWLFDELKITSKVWTSLTRVNGTNDFVWVDGTKLTQKNEENLYKNWHKCEPNDFTTTAISEPNWPENCVEMYSSYYPFPLRCDEAAIAGQWNDIPCTVIYNVVVCEGKKKIRE